jgi:AcrR family transcriptional regulator
VPNHTKRRERERQELRFKIIEAGRALFTRGGEAAVTLRAVAEMIEFSATAIYLHFPSKEALVHEVCAMEFAGFARLVRQAEALPEPMVRLRKIASLYVNFGLQFPEHYRYLFMRDAAPIASKFNSRQSPGKAALPGNDASNTEKTAPYESLRRAVFKAMAAGCFKPEYRDVALLTQSLWSCLHGVVALHLVRAQQADVPWMPLQTILEMTLEAFCNGVTTPVHQVAPTWRRSESAAVETQPLPVQTSDGRNAAA